MKVSIVTISFNQIKFIERAICSVLNQDYPDIEYIIVDPGSTDGSLDIIDQYKNRISSIIIEPDKGPADGLNKGFSVATGDILAYINADDALLPGAVSAAVKVFKAKSFVDVVIGHGYLVDPHEKVIHRVISAPFNVWRFAYGAVTVMQQSTFFKRSIFRAVDGFNVNNRTSWDAELLLNMGLERANIKIVNDFWSIFTIHPDSITGSQTTSGEYLMDCNRYFKMIMGRETKFSDYWWRKIAWIQRWFLDPLGAGKRLTDILFGAPTLNYSFKKINGIE